MSSKLDQSLDSIIASKRTTQARPPRAAPRAPPASSSATHSGPSNGAGGAPRAAHPLSRAPRAGAPPRHHPYAGTFAGASFVPAVNPGQQWSHDLYAGGAAGAGAAAPAVDASKVVSDTVFLTNLPPHVTSDDLREIFGSLGAIASLNLFYDQNGRSVGNAQIVFRAAAHAEKAVQEFDQAAVDGQTITVKLVGGTVVTKPLVQKAAPSVVHVPVPVPVPQPLYAPSAPYGGRYPLVQAGAYGAPGAPGAAGRPYGGAGRPGPASGPSGAARPAGPARAGAPAPRAAGAPRTRAPHKPLTAADLDAELDAYRASASKSGAAAAGGADTAADGGAAAAQPAEAAASSAESDA